MKIFRRKIADLIRNQHGVAMLEFAFALPVFIFLTLATIEISNYIYANQKAQNAAYNVLNLVNLQYNLTNGQLDRIAAVVPGVVTPLPMAEGQYTVYLTAMQKDTEDDPAYIRWQHVYGPLENGASRFEFTKGAAKADNPVPPEAVKGYQFTDGDQLIAVELYMFYEPLVKSDIIGSLFDMRDDHMYFFATARPRKGAFQFDPDELSE